MRCLGCYYSGSLSLQLKYTQTQKGPPTLHRGTSGDKFSKKLFFLWLAFLSWATVRGSEWINLPMPVLQSHQLLPLHSAQCRSQAWTPHGPGRAPSLPSGPALQPAPLGLASSHLLPSSGEPLPLLWLMQKCDGLPTPRKGFNPTCLSPNPGNGHFNDPPTGPCGAANPQQLVKMRKSVFLFSV